MEIIHKRYVSTCKAIATLGESLDNVKDPQFISVRSGLRDSVIQRFEYSVDTLWKFLKMYMQEKLKITDMKPSPREVLKTALHTELILLDEFKILIACIADRNLTSHSYNEDLAEEILKRVPEYYGVFQVVIKRINIE